MEKLERYISEVLTGICLVFSVSAFSFSASAGNISSRDSVQTDAKVVFCGAKKIGAVMNMFDYASTVTQDTSDTRADLYVKWRIKTVKSNIILSVIPSLNVIKDNKEDLEEYYSSVTISKNSSNEEKLIAREGTIPHNKKTFPTMAQFFIPDIYSRTLFNENILSPFNKANRKYYKYGLFLSTDSNEYICFTPRKVNTQLVSGTAVTDKRTGRILEAQVSGEYDMMSYNIVMDMRKEGQPYPNKSDLIVDFKLAGNKVNSEIISLLLPPGQVTEGTQMDSLRPVPLTEVEKGIYSRYDSLLSVKSRKPSSSKKKTINHTAWKNIGNRLFNTFNTNLGPNNEFSFKTSPLLNPSYLSYSQRKGVIYRFDLKGNYLISDNSSFFFRTRMGYMFNKRQFFFDAPFILTYNARRNGTIGLTLGNGNRIRNSSIREQLLLMDPDSKVFQELDLDHYTDNYAKVNTTYNITDRLSTNVSVAFHQRSPVNEKDFLSIGQPTSYRTFSPMVEVKYRPLKDKGPIFTIDYERGIKDVFKSGIEYEKIEGDAEWMIPLAPLSSVSMRFGGGIYTNKDDGIYFLDFANFRDNNLPGGWNDDWSGEFQLLDPALYNISRYYLRSNLTFEHPMLLASYFPWAGRFIETERIYVNSLLVERINPYMEFGYGFTNRFFSMGVYASFKNWNFERIGCRFTLELFSNWN